MLSLVGFMGASPTAARLILLALLSAASGCGLRARPSEAASAVYVRSDTDRTTVVSPRARVAAVLGDAAELEASHAVDAWSSASVDITTAATGVVRERRHETNAGVGWRSGAWALSGGYRYSTEPDYWSHGGSLRLSRDLAQKNATLALAAFGSADVVGRAGDPGFRQNQSFGGARLTYSQMLGPRVVAELQWETLRVGGFQASPYRFVALGGAGTCALAAPFCVPEHVPDERFRHAPALRARWAVARTLSLGLAYRFYFDSWGLRSHTLEPDLAWLVGERGTLTLFGRYYTQDDASFYRARYQTVQDAAGYVTRDRKLSAFYTLGAGLSYMHEIPLGTDGAVLMAGLRAGLIRFRYLDFVGLERVSVVEATGLLGLRFE
jgi:hypothetical protein